MEQNQEEGLPVYILTGNPLYSLHSPTQFHPLPLKVGHGKVTSFLWTSLGLILNSEHDIRVDTGAWPWPLPGHFLPQWEQPEISKCQLNKPLLSIRPIGLGNMQFWWQSQHLAQGTLATGFVGTLVEGMKSGVRYPDSKSWLHPSFIVWSWETPGHWVSATSSMQHEW